MLFVGFACEGGLVGFEIFGCYWLWCGVFGCDLGVCVVLWSLICFGLFMGFACVTSGAIVLY